MTIQTLETVHEMTFRLKGTKPLLMSNGRMADPHDEYALEYQTHNARKPNTRSKKYKENPELMLEWLAEERRIQFFGGVYWDSALGFHMPADNLLYMVRESFFGYGTTSLGGDRLLSILRTDREAYPLAYDGPKTPAARYEADLFRVGRVSNKALGGAKVRVLQPVFHNWSIEFGLQWTKEAERPSILGRGKDFNKALLLENLKWQGKTFGLGAYRKSGNFGNFVVDVVADREFEVKEAA